MLLLFLLLFVLVLVLLLLVIVIVNVVVIRRCCHLHGNCEPQDSFLAGYSYHLIVDRRNGTSRSSPPPLSLLSSLLTHARTLCSDFLPYATLQTTFTRYEARVQPADLSSDEATELQLATADEGSTGELEGWLRGSGTTWSGASVTSVEGVVVEELSVVTPSMSSSGELFLSFFFFGSCVFCCCWRYIHAARKKKEYSLVLVQYTTATDLKFQPRTIP